ncbi:hypothetical protein AUP68_10866 [Ilyonectria robusta]
MAGSKRDFQDLCQFLEEKKVSISPIVDRVFSFHESEDAFNYLYSGKHIGKTMMESIPNRSSEQASDYNLTCLTVTLKETSVIGISTASTPSELDELASALMNLLTPAAKAASRPTRKGVRTAPWWTEECAGAAAVFRVIRRLYPLGFNQEVQIAKRDFHRVVRRAKRVY